MNRKSKYSTRNTTDNDEDIIDHYFGQPRGVKGGGIPDTTTTGTGTAMFQTESKRQRTGKRRTTKKPLSLTVLIMLFCISFFITWSLPMRTLLSSTKEPERWMYPQQGTVLHPRLPSGHNHSSSLPLRQLLPPPQPVQVLLTTMGWNHPDPNYGMTFGRSQFQAKLYQGILDHPWYNPTGWEDLLSMTMPTTTTTTNVRDSLGTNDNNHKKTRNNTADKPQRSYIFVDVETCYEDNYPHYGLSLTANSDVENGRPPITSSGGRIRHLKAVCLKIMEQIQLFHDATIFRQEEPQLQHGNKEQDNDSDDGNNHRGSNIDVTFILFDCGYNGPPRWSCLNRQTNPLLNEIQVSIVTESSPITKVSSSWDLGLPPPAINPVSLSPTQVDDVLYCHQQRNGGGERPIFFSFTGNFRSSVRQELLKLHDPSNGILIQPYNTTGVGSKLSILAGQGRRQNLPLDFSNTNASYTTLLSQSEFAAVPRGDNLFSYRFTEVLSGGCIPVIYSDGWLLPFASEFIDWRSIAVILPEGDVSRTVEYLSNLTTEDRCRMKRTGYEFYQRYMSTPQGVISGIIDSLEVIRSKPKK